MTNEELDEAIDLVTYYQEWRRGGDGEQPNPKALGVAIDDLLKSARTLSELMHGTHKDLVVVPRSPTKEIVAFMKRAESGEFTIGEAWRQMLSAARKDGV